jgi:excisionase family DNA binding protein
MKDAYELRLYSCEEASELLHLGRTYLYYCRMAGVLQYTKVGRRVLYTYEQLAAFQKALVEDAPRVHRLVQRFVRRRRRGRLV